MEVSSIEGNFKATCVEVMRVLRSNKESVMAMLEAFVHDPLINWRLLNTADTPADSAAHPHEAVAGEAAGVATPTAPADLRVGLPSPPRQPATREQVFAAYGGIEDANEVLNERAVAVMKRMSDKLTGRDFTGDSLPSGMDSDSVAVQVQRLIASATSHENLCQSYIGWCAFW